MDILDIYNKFDLIDKSDNLLRIKFYEENTEELRGFHPKNENELSTYSKLINELSFSYSELDNNLKAIELVENSMKIINRNKDLVITGLSSYDPLTSAIFLKSEYLTYNNQNETSIEFLREQNVLFPENKEIAKFLLWKTLELKNKLPRLLFKIGIILTLLFMVLLLTVKEYKLIILISFISSVILLITGYSLSTYYLTKKKNCA